MGKWRIPMGFAHLIVTTDTAEQAVERAEKWRGLFGYAGLLVASPEVARPIPSTERTGDK